MSCSACQIGPSISYWISGGTQGQGAPRPPPLHPSRQNPKGLSVCPSEFVSTQLECQVDFDPVWEVRFQLNAACEGGRNICPLCLEPSVADFLRSPLLNRKFVPYLAAINRIPISVVDACARRTWRWWRGSRRLRTRRALPRGSSRWRGSTTG
jgi:hypothetical protein